MQEQTLKDIMDFSGVGVHSGVKAKVRVLPKESGGIEFKRIDMPEAAIFRAHYSNVTTTEFATTIGKGEARVSTVEHLLSAFYSMGVDHAMVEINGPEMPVLDGSAARFVEMIEKIGLKKLAAPRKYMIVKKPVRINDGDRFAYLLPFRKRDEGQVLEIEYTMDFVQKNLDRQSYLYSHSEYAFRSEIMGARTYGYLKDVETMRKHGLAKGGSLDNAVVIGEDLIVNDEGLRYPDEFVRHKILDFLGDISLAGAPIIGRVKAYKSGHGLNYKLTKAFVETPGAFEYVELDENGHVINTDVG